MMTDRDTLSRIDGLPTPRHLFVLPNWLNSNDLDRLIEQGLLDCGHLQRDSVGQIQVAMNIELTPKAKRLLHPSVNWSDLALKGSLAGASFTAMSFLILYLG